MAPKKWLDRVVCWELYGRLRSYRKVADFLKEMGVVNPYNGKPPSHVAVMDAIQEYAREHHVQVPK